MMGFQQIGTKKYMYRSFIEGKFDHFMTIEELQAVSSRTSVRIGVHSHFHDVILTRTHPRKRKPISKWKLERFQNLPDMSRQDLSIRSKLAFQGFNCRDELLMQRTEAEWEEYINDVFIWIKYSVSLAGPGSNSEQQPATSPSASSGLEPVESSRVEFRRVESLHSVF